MTAADLMPAREPGPARLVGTLVTAGVGSGVLLTAAFLLTLPAIERNRKAALRAAVFQVVPGTATMQKLVLRGESFAPAGDGDPPQAPAVYATYDPAGEFLGWAIPGAGPGFADTVTLIYGYDPTRRCVVGMRVLESRETPGLGDKIFKDLKFVAEFDALAVDPPIAVVKNGAGSKPHEVDGITGATISSKAIVKILNTANAAVLGKLPPPDRVPPAPPPEVPR